MRLGLLFALCLGAVLGQKAELERPEDEKEFKKLLRTKTNVLVVFAKDTDSKAFLEWRKICEEAANTAYGKGTIAIVDCSDTNGRKLCKKQKATPDPVVLKHYQSGEFHKDYDRAKSAASLGRFLLDPAGDTPWEEDATGTDVLHISSAADWRKLLKKETGPILAMFYAPWCGHCKRLKPAYGEAASELKGSKKLAAVDLTLPETSELAKLYDVSGYPTLIYFEGGKKKMMYGGDHSKDGLISWMKDPKPPQEKPKEVPWSEEPSQVAHLTVASFDEFIAAHDSVVVMFYAPWCGHCKKMKPDYTEAANALAEEGQPGKLAAVDATQEKALQERFEVKGFPTLKYFKAGQFAWDLTSERTKEALLNFMRSPEEPPPPPPPEVPWPEQETDVVHLKADNFKAELKRKKHALVMFYAPWCGHCKSAKPEYNEAAAELKDLPKVMLAAVDCTVEQTICSEYDVNGFPTFKYITYGKSPADYNSGRKKADFVAFMKEKSGPSEEPTTIRPPIRKEQEAQPPSAVPSSEWDMDGGDDVLLLGDDDFASELAKTELALVMFYAPWCGHCKRAKPQFAQAAKQAKEGHALVAVDCTVYKNLCSEHGARAYPTLKLFKGGVFEKDYKGERTAEAFLAAAEGREPPAKEPEPPKAEDKWDTEGAEFVHMLNAGNFKETLERTKNALVMFYAPWCGHCKKAKPAYAQAAMELKPDNALVAVDCTVHRDLCSEHGVKGYPTIQVWKDGAFVEKYKGQRTMEGFRSAANGEAPPPPPPPAPDTWDMEGGDLVKKLGKDDFASVIGAADRAIVMFYAPWCGHCKRAKPEFSLAAKELGEGQILAAVDCTVHREFCQEHSVRGYPTIQYFEKGEFVEKYSGGRTKADFLAKLQKQDEPAKEEL